jgi:hypothetical protein
MSTGLRVDDPKAMPPKVRRRVAQHLGGTIGQGRTMWRSSVRDVPICNGSTENPFKD